MEARLGYRGENAESSFDVERKNYIGGTDAPGVLGLSRWSSPLKVWAEKTGLVPKEDVREKLQVKLGNRLEQTVAELFTEETGLKVHRVNETIFHDRFPFLGANLDRRVVGEKAILECKTTSGWKAKEWEGEDIPKEFIIQCFHYLAVTGMNKAYIAVLIGNQDFKWKEINRDEMILNDLVKREVDFWKNYVELKVMPKVITKYDADTLAALYPQEQGEEKTLDDEANKAVDNLESYKADLRNLEGLIELEENKLKALLGDAKAGYTSLCRVSWANSSWTGLDGKKLKIEMPEIYEKYLQKKLTRRFSYKKLAEGN